LKGHCLLSCPNLKGARIDYANRDSCAAQAFFCHGNVVVKIAWRFARILAAVNVSLRDWEKGNNVWLVN